VVAIKAIEKDDSLAGGSFEWPVDGVVSGPLAVVHPQEDSFQTDQIAITRSLICTSARRNSATCVTQKGSQKRSFGG